MINKFKITMLLAVFVISVTAGKWYGDGQQIYTKTKQETIVVEKDEIFGTETKTSKWEEKFLLGVLPSGTTPKEMIGALPIAGLMVIVIAGAWWFERKSKK